MTSTDVDRFFASAAHVEWLHREPAPPLRIWIVGCTPGERIRDFLAQLGARWPAASWDAKSRIFITDAGREPVEEMRLLVSPHARPAYGVNGTSPSASAPLSVVPQHVFRSLILSVHDMLGAPPFAKLDFIYCPGSLAEYSAPKRQSVFDVFHQALNRTGRMLLGDPDAIPPAPAIFAPLAECPGLFRHVRQAPASSSSSYLTNLRHVGTASRETVLNSAARQALIEEYAAPIVLVDKSDEIVYARGLSPEWLRKPSARSPAERSALHSRLQAAVRRLCARFRKHRTPIQDEIVDPTDKEQVLRLKARAVNGHADAEIAVILERAPLLQVAASAAADPVDNGGESIELRRRLELTRAELARMEDEHQRTMQSLSISNAEISATYEEARAANEELQSAQDDLASRNEALRRVNDRLQKNIGDLERVNNDVMNLLRNTDTATLMLDEGLRVQQFNEPAAAMFDLYAADVGRDFRDLVAADRHEDLTTVCLAVLDDLVPRQKEVEAAERWFLRRVAPYRTRDRRIAGVVITCGDVTQVKQAALKQALLATVLLDSREAVIVFDREGRMITWNQGAEHIYGYAGAEMLGRPIEAWLAGGPPPPPPGGGAFV
jgi:two-component system CheB/CheR fusion protein